jgi:hypothetical protein
MSLVSGAVNDLGQAAAKAGDDLLATATADVTQQIIPGLLGALQQFTAGKRLVVTVTVEVKDKPMGPTLDPQ